MLQFLAPLFTSVAGQALKEGFNNAVEAGDKETIKQLALKAEKPFFQSKRLITTTITTIILLLNRKLGLDLGVEEISAIVVLISIYVGSKSYEQKK